MPHCNQTEAYLVDWRCITFKRPPRGENYRELMRKESPNCHKDGGGKYRSNRVSLVNEMQSLIWQLSYFKISSNRNVLIKL
jgi:hypothetical protein